MPAPSTGHPETVEYLRPVSDVRLVCLCVYERERACVTDEFTNAVAHSVCTVRLLKTPLELISFAIQIHCSN